MPQEPIYDSITFSTQLTPLLETVKVELKTDVISEDVSKVLCVNAVSTISNYDVSVGKISFSGKTAFSVIYELNTGEIKKTENGADFSGTILSDSITNNTEVILCSEIVKTDYSLLGTRLTVSAVAKVTAIPQTSCQINALSSGDNLVMNNGEATVVRGYGVKTDNYPIEEEFTLNYQVREVLTHNAMPVITAVQCGVGCIIIDGEVYLSSLLLQSGEKSDIIREDRVMPFRVELEYGEAMPTISATAFVNIKSFKTDITVDEENNKSQVLASVILQFSSCAYSEKVCPVVLDAFCTTNQLELKKEESSLLCPKALRSCTSKVAVKTNISELPAGVRLMSIGSESFEVISSTPVENGILVSGVLTAYAFTRDSDGNNGVVKVEAPVETTVDCVTCEFNYNLKCVSVNTTARLTTLDTIELETELVFTVYINEINKFSYISSVSVGEEKVTPTCAISVYLALEGEDVWELSKRLNVCPEELKSTNKELTFPLTSNERIVIYRQK